MAATRLIALHVNKGKTVAQCLADRTDYSQNAAKTNDGEFISSYECDPKTADEEFLLSKRQYQHITGRQQKNNIIAYQIRQSFKPGEITPEEANQVGYETAMRWTKGKHAFIVATHIDKSHIHNHIIYNSTSLDATRKFKNFFLSGLAVQRLSDMVCLEHGLSIITPKPYRERQKRTVYPKKRTQRDELCDAIDAVLKQKPKSFDGFVQALADMGFEFKDGKQPAFKGENQKRFIRLRSLGEGYSKEEIQAVISGKNLHKSKGGSAKAPAPKQFQMLIDIQAKMAEGKTVGYEKWAKKFNRKEYMSSTTLFYQMYYIARKGAGYHDALLTDGSIPESSAEENEVYHDNCITQVCYNLLDVNGDGVLDIDDVYVTAFTTARCGAGLSNSFYLVKGRYDLDADTINRVCEADQSGYEVSNRDYLMKELRLS